MCSCQAYGKSGVPNARGYCLVCGEPVGAVEAPGAAPVPANACPVFQPDHNGECLHCDEGIDAHSPEAIARGEA